jgi:hypothetical protein
MSLTANTLIAGTDSSGRPKPRADSLIQLDSLCLQWQDGDPFPVPLKAYNESLAVLLGPLNAARLGHTEKLQRFK